VPKGKHVKVNVAPSPAPALVHRVVIRPGPSSGSNDGRLAACVMAEVPSVASALSSSSRGCVSSESIRDSPPPIPYVLVSSVLPDIAEMPDVETIFCFCTHNEIDPRADASAGMFLYT
jgi:hypothetical protein